MSWNSLKQTDTNDISNPMANHSRNLGDNRKNYVIIELECLTIVDTLDKFYHYLHGQKFVIYTDHVILTWLKNVKSLRA